MLEVLDKVVEIVRSSTMYLIVFVLFFFIIANWLKGALKLLIDLVLAPLFKHKVTMIRAFGKTFKNDGDGFRVVNSGSATNIQSYPFFDFDKYKNIEAEKQLRLGDQLMILAAVISLIVSLIVGVPLALAGRNLTNIVFVILASLGLGLIFHNVVSLGITIYSVYKSKTSLAGYMSSAIAKIRNGATYDMLNLEPIDKLPYKNVIKTERLLYFSFYYLYLESIEKYDEMPALARNAISELPDNFVESYVPLFANLLDYYSHYEIDDSKAHHLYNRVGEYLVNDKDANSKRILAYYEANINKDIEKARAYANEARVAVNNAKFRCDQVLEANCVRKLDDYLGNF